MSPILLPLNIFALFSTFIAPGLLLAVLLSIKKNIRPVYAIPIAALISGYIGYTVFWIYALSPLAGNWIATLILILSWSSIIVLCLHPKLRSFLLQADIVIPFILIVFIAIIYNGIALSCRTDEFSRSCYIASMPLDNDISQLFANNVADGKKLDLIGDWHGSDRPPLQTGVLLSQRFFTSEESTGGAYAQLLASILQCLWIPAVWIIGRIIGLSRQRAILVIIFLSITGLIFFNSVLVWPKLLAASFVLLTICLLFFEKKALFTWTIASLAAGAALLSHMSTAFTLIPIVLIALAIKQYRPNLKTLLISGGCLLLILGSWILYQKLIDPPGDRLTKWFFAGQTKVDDVTAPEAIRDAYSRSSMLDAVKTRIKNASLLIGRTSSQHGLVGETKTAKLRDGEFRYLLVSLGALNIGWFALLSKRVRSRLRNDKLITPFKILSGIIAGSLTLWIALLFSPGMAINHQNSFTTILLFLLIAATLVSYLPRKIVMTVACIQLLYFVLIWIIDVTLHNPTTPSYLIVIIITIIAVSVYFYKQQSWLKIRQ